MTVIALIDGPLSPDLACCDGVLEPAGAAFVDSPAGVHAASVAATILSVTTSARFISIPVFTGRLSATAANLAEALTLAAGTPADIIHCSLGLARNDADVARAIEALDGRIVLASAPARGGPVWPAAHASVIGVQGDARCRFGEWSCLALQSADYGACPYGPAGSDAAGASIAAANLTGILAARSMRTPAQARALLDQQANYRGRERKSAANADADLI